MAKLVASFNAEMNGEVEPNAQPPASQLLLVEASSPPHVGIEHLRWLVREPSFKQTHVRSITTAVEREEMGIPANPQVGTRNSLTSRLNLQSAESTAFLDPGRDIISDDLYQIILTFVVGPHIFAKMQMKMKPFCSCWMLSQQTQQQSSEKH